MSGKRNVNSIERRIASSIWKLLCKSDSKVTIDFKVIYSEIDFAGIPEVIKVIDDLPELFKRCDLGVQNQILIDNQDTNLSKIYRWGLNHIQHHYNFKSIQKGIDGDIFSKTVAILSIVLAISSLLYSFYRDRTNQEIEKQRENRQIETKYYEQIIPFYSDFIKSTNQMPFYINKTDKKDDFFLVMNNAMTSLRLLEKYANEEKKSIRYIQRDFDEVSFRIERSFDNPDLNFDYLETFDAIESINQALYDELEDSLDEKLKKLAD